MTTPLDAASPPPRGLRVELCERAPLAPTDCPACSGALDDVPPEHRIHNHIDLSPEAWEQFERLIADPPQPSAALRAIMRRRP